MNGSPRTSESPDEIASTTYPGSTLEDLEETNRLIKETGRQAVLSRADVRDYDAVKAAFDKGIADLQPNEISEPFKTRYGWHIVQMLGTRTYDSTDDVRRQKAFAAIRESKADEETELWLRRLRDDAFVETKM